MPSSVYVRKKTPLEERILAHILIDDGCWEWTGTRYKGRGTIKIDSHTTAPAYRAVYKMLIGDLKTEEYLHHTCENPGCVRPSHLMVVSLSQHNTIHAKPREYCKRGHLLSAENVYISGGSRWCRQCKLASVKAYYRDISSIRGGGDATNAAD